MRQRKRTIMNASTNEIHKDKTNKIDKTDKTNETDKANANQRAKKEKEAEEEENEEKMQFVIDIAFNQ